MHKRSRLVGIDLFRGIAVFGVVILHADEGISAQPLLWSWITHFALFTVPFFLATSFYLALDKLYSNQSSYPLRLRLTRLLIPYGCWSVLYLLYKTAKLIITNDINKLLALFKDPISIIFCGGSAFHLYFLPLLVAGTVLIKGSELLIRNKVSLKSLILISVVSFLLYGLLLETGNDYRNDLHIAFKPFLDSISPLGTSNPILRLILIEIAYGLRCFPYVMLGLVLAHPSLHKFQFKFINGHHFVWMAIFFLYNSFGGLVLPQSFYEVTRGYSALLCAIALSGLLNDSSLLKNLGACSFGIYFIHLFFVEIFQSISVRLYPNNTFAPSTPTLIIISILIFIISWAAISLLIKLKKISKILFGI